MSDTLWDLIHSNVAFEHLSATGYHTYRCPICNDYTDRGGIKYEDGKIHATCFNCKFNAGYEDGDTTLRRRMRELLDRWNIDRADVDRCLGQEFFKKAKREVISEKSITTESKIIKPVDLPKGAVRLGGDGMEEEQIAAAEYLIGRKIDLKRWTFYVAPSYPKRVIVPFFHHGRLVFWQARSLLPKSVEKKRYISDSAPREGVFFNADELHGGYQGSPLYVVEGPFDAMSIPDTVALAGSTINPEKVKMLRESNRAVSFILDQNDNGMKLGEQALSLDFSVSFTPPGCDVNESIRRYDLPYVAWYVRHNTFSGVEGQVQTMLRCK